MTANYALLGQAFQEAPSVKEEYPESATYLEISLTTNGYPGGYDTLVPEPDGLYSGISNIGYACAQLNYIPGGWQGKSIGQVKVQAYVPPRFSGQVQYSRVQVQLDQLGAPGVPPAPIGPFEAENLQLSIIAPFIAGPYTLALQSPSLTGTCALDTSSDGSVLFGLLNGVLVAVTFLCLVNIPPPEGR